MNGIYFKEGIYVTIDDGRSRNDICVYNYYKDNVSLYGGRIRITQHDSEAANLIVDGISIINIWDNRIINVLLLSEIVSHLNAIETYGVDTFLGHYKKSIEFLYGELKELNQNAESQLTIEQEDSNIKSILSELTKIRDLLLSVLAILFSLNTLMSAGLENEKVLAICQSVMDSLA
jgi:hypothetical protein